MATTHADVINADILAFFKALFSDENRCARPAGKSSVLQMMPLHGRPGRAARTPVPLLVSSPAPICRFAAISVVKQLKA
jgi:hypothetical protein